MAIDTQRITSIWTNLKWNEEIYDVMEHDNLEANTRAITQIVQLYMNPSMHCIC
jgi:hypothetical protein